MKNINIKTILITIFLFLLTFLIIVGIMGIFVSGPVIKNQKDEEKIVEIIREDEKTCQSVTRYSFEFVTYTCETPSTYIIYDKNGEKIASRKKNKTQFGKVKEKQAKYTEFNGVEPIISYGYESVVYVFEKGSNMLMFDFDSLELLFYSGGE